MLTRDAVNYVMSYTVSDTETLRKVHLFIWPETYNARTEQHADFFSAQDLPKDESRARIAEFLAAARAQSASTSPNVIATTAADSAARLARFQEMP